MIFSRNPGTVVAIEDDFLPVAFTFPVDGSNATFNNLKSIITSVGISAQSGFQLAHSLREFIYIYVFTERAGDIVLNGLAFPVSCGALGPQDDNDFNSGNDDCGVTGTTGIERLLEWYECNRITSRAAPITISFDDGVSYDAFLVGLKADITDPTTGIAQFTMRFVYIPHTVDVDDACFPFDENCTTESPCGPQS